MVALLGATRDRGELNRSQRLMDTSMIEKLMILLMACQQAPCDNELPQGGSRRHRLLVATDNAPAPVDSVPGGGGPTSTVHNHLQEKLPVPGGSESYLGTLLTEVVAPRMSLTTPTGALSIGTNSWCCLEPSL